MKEPRWEALLDRVRREYNPPPATPREEMWAKIQETLPEGSIEVQPRSDGRLVRPWRYHRGTLSALAAIAALLLLWVGFGIGRASAPGSVAPRTAAAEGGPDDTGEAATDAVGRAPVITTQMSDRGRGSPMPENAYSFATARLLASTGTLLSQVEGQAATGVLPADAGEWARGLLTQTRLMLDSPNIEKGGLRTLLEDLELVLMQVVNVSGAEDAGDREMGGFELEQLTNELKVGDVLPRIRRMLPPVLASDS